MKAKLLDDKLIELIARLQAGEGTEKEASQWLEELSYPLGNPNVSDLIFYSKENLTPEQIVKKAREYKPWQMPPPAARSKRGNSYVLRN